MVHINGLKPTALSGMPIRQKISNRELAADVESAIGGEIGY